MSILAIVETDFETDLRFLEDVGESMRMFEISLKTTRKTQLFPEVDAPFLFPSTVDCFLR